MAANGDGIIASLSSTVVPVSVLRTLHVSSLSNKWFSTCHGVLICLFFFECNMAFQNKITGALRDTERF
jgi:hypothetical protein